MKKVENEFWFGLMVIVVCYLFYLTCNSINASLYSKEQPLAQKTEPPMELIYVEESAVEDIRTSSHKENLFSSEEIHTNLAWLNCEEMANGCHLAIELFEAETPKDPEIALLRKQACDTRIEMIRKSRKGQISPRNSWGKQLSDTLGVKPGLVRLFEKGIAVYSGDSLYFFHHLALEIGLKELSKNTKILVERGKDKHWYPTIVKDDSTKVPLTYWGIMN